jgi:hypothetical protein
MNSKAFSSTVQARHLLVVFTCVFAATPVYGSSFIHGLSSVRDESKPQTPAEIYGDLFYLRGAIAETTFAEPVKKRLDLLVGHAQDDLLPPTKVGDAGPVAIERAGKIRRDLDDALEKSLKQQEVDELNRRTVILAWQEFLFADGPIGAFDQMARTAGLKLTKEQEGEIRPLLEDADARVMKAGHDWTSRNN